jgi:hypothetical protein
MGRTYQARSVCYLTVAALVVFRILVERARQRFILGRVDRVHVALIRRAVVRFGHGVVVGV